MALMRESMSLAAKGNLPPDLCQQMHVAPDVLELRLPDWFYSGGKMHTRLYYSEPFGLPANLVALRLLTKRPGPLGVELQTEHAKSASDLLLEFEKRSFR